jgi:hypothetical protein
MALNLLAWIGPQSAGEAPTVRRHRFHQSWYRAFVLGVPCGTGPRPRDTTLYGNMLRIEEAAAGSNFLTDEIHQIAEVRIAEGGTVEPFRCRHNMLSSQPMCFNLIGPLQTRPALAAAFVHAAIGTEVEVEPDGVRIEDSPGHLGDNTGLDASIRYRTVNGRRGVLGIETKLSEQFSPKVYDLDSKPASRRYSQASRSPFDQGQLELLTDSRWNQLWRNQLLCEAIADQEQRELADQLVLYPDNADGTAALVTEYASLLRRGDAVVARTLAEIVDPLRQAAKEADRAWLENFRVRYVDLQLSQRLYDTWRAEVLPASSPELGAGAGPRARG